MKLGTFLVLFGDKPLEDALDTVQQAGLEAVEIGTGGYPGDAHCNPEELLADEAKLNAFKQAIDSRGLTISALSCHGNPIHPNPEISQQHHHQFEQTVLLAEKLGVDTVVTFSGCPGESEHSKYPVWVTAAWPEDHPEILAWQWQERVIPYWKEQNDFLAKHNVRVAIEPHPGFVVYNNETALKLRRACGEQIGVNFDPSHLFWQQMDPVVSIKELGREGALFHFHAKDTAIDKQNTEANGVLDTKPYTDELNRSWIFRTVGFGHGIEEWKRIISALQLVGYEGAVSIEHEDSLMSVEEGFQKAVDLLQEALIKEKVGDVWWA
ncbi:sugar phosphate isomerase/epimerase family protein [Gracilibacillus alcaliphilus]|uniref:sugar phosphate isomerase/epimerase family protein n=1 Tax=Gracilibacillus alcaliphilus TaxID=1401441 RepID=UPI00195D133D|nr:sugar phosphate isomerase/epimerase [Gracilibacillus alcaliphilus]MBM7678680.1 sugar phosphate isomerase/epimerase [Gracilibacillus alcaliphilus]